MAIVQNILCDSIPNIMSLVSNDYVKSLSDNIRFESEQRFNNMFGNSYYQHQNERGMFLDIFKRHSEEINNIVENTLHSVFMDDKIICIDSEEKLMKGVPKTMEMALITSDSLRRALENDEIYGFGIDPKNLPEKDIYDRLINNCLTNDNGIGIGYVSSEDPMLTIKDLDNIEDTRYFMELLLEQGIDPTDYPNRVGKIKK